MAAGTPKDKTNAKATQAKAKQSKKATTKTPAKATQKTVAKAKAVSHAMNASTAMKAPRMKKSVHFFRPNTLKLKRSPKYPRHVQRQYGKALDKYSIIKYPISSESSMKKVEEINTLVFIVNAKANKAMIKKAFDELYKVKSVKINTLIRPDGLKKAFIRLSPDYEAVDVASKIGVV